jgi:predicted nucleic acid-binding protein
MERNLILDAGALIGLERGSEMVIVMAEQAHERGGSTVIPASVLAQVWRGGPKAARLARIVAGSNIDSLDEDRAKEIGVRLGARNGSDVADAHVACCAVELQAIVATSDRDDIEALIEPDDPVRLIPV